MKLQQRVDLRAAGLDRIDMMSGIEFEQYVAAVLGGSGFAVTLTKTTGDFGVDLIAVKDGLRTAVTMQNGRLARWARRQFNRWWLARSCIAARR